MKIVTLDQGTDEWLRWREQGVSASDMATVLRMNEHETPHKLWMVKRGICEPDDLSRNPHVRRGKRMEPVLRQIVAQERNDTILPLCAESETHPLIRASFDGIDSSGEPNEFKAPSAKRYIEAKECWEASKIKRLYYPQIQCQIFVSKARRGRMILGHFEETAQWGRYDLLDWFEVIVERDDAFIAKMIAAAEEFWAMVQKGEAPALDPERDVWFPATMAERALWAKAAEELHDMLAEEEALGRRIKELQEAQRKNISRLKNLLRGHKVGLWGGLKFQRIKRKGKVNYPALLKDRGIELTDEDMDAYRGEETTSYKASLVED